MSKKLLLADDSVVIQKLVGLSFANEDVEIVATDNGDDAVVMAREITPDVVLADVVMPGKSGYEVCEAIKQDPALAHIPVLLLTGTFEAFDEARAVAAGANGQITKPFEAQALVERVSEIMNAPPPAPDVVEASIESETPTIESFTTDYDFFESDLTTLSAGDSAALFSSAETPSIDSTPALDVSDAHLFGAPGEGATGELDTLGGGLALGESVASDRIPDVLDTPDTDATVAILPDSPPPLPPSVGDPLIGFEDDFGTGGAPITPPEIPSTSFDLGSALDGVPSNRRASLGATLVAAIDDTNATTFPNQVLDSDSEHDSDPDDAGTAAIDDEFENLTVHTPSSAIDQDVATAPSPVAIGSIPISGRPKATVVANLDVSRAEPVPEFTPRSLPTPRTTPTSQPIDLGPSNVSPQELDFAFDVSEQVSAADLPDPLAESFSSLMDISESQILAGPPSDPPLAADDVSSSPVVDDSFAAGYDVSSSDLATAAPPPAAPVMSDFAGESDDSIAFGLQNAGLQDAGLQNDLQADLPDGFEEDRRDDLRDDDSRGAIPDSAATIFLPGDDELELGTAAPTSSQGDQIADLSPLVEQRIQETLEKVAWEAFSDLSESIVKQVIGRVEKIAWEVIPQMAETLVREEIRKMKGEKD
jgi:CheY-like chemotaxis protein